MDGSEDDGDLVLIQTFLLYYVNQVILMLTSIFQGQFPYKAKEVCIKTRSPSASHSLGGWGIKCKTVKSSILYTLYFLELTLTSEDSSAANTLSIHYFLYLRSLLL